MATTPRESVRATVGANKITRANKDTPFQVATVTDLRALSVVGLFDGQKFALVCHTTVGDGGGGDFYYSANSVASDDGGVIIAPTSGAGRYIRIYSNAVDIRWYGAKCDGATDDTVAVQAAIDSGNESIFVSGVALVNGLSIYQKAGINIRGLGAGSQYGEQAKGGLKYNGGAGGCIFSDIGGTNLTFEHIQINGNGRVGDGIWLKNNPDSSDVTTFIRFQNVVFYQCDSAILVGGNASSGVNNYNQINGDNCIFYQNTISVDVRNANTEFMHFKNCQMTGGYTHYFYSTSGAYCQLSNVYIGAMQAGAAGAVNGAFVLDWDDVWVELGISGAYTINATDNGGVQSSRLNKCHLSHSGDGSNITVYWSAGSPLVITNSYIAGKIRYTSNARNCCVISIGNCFIPAPGGLTQTVGTGPDPLVAGQFTGAAGTYTVEIVTGGTPFTATYKWKKDAGAFTGALPTKYRVHMDAGIIMQFRQSLTFVSGDQWTFDAAPCGIVESGGVLKPEAAQIVKLARTSAQSINDSTETVILFDSATNDADDEYSTTTGLFTALRSGWYNIDAIGGLSSLAADKRLIGTLQVNGVNVYGSQMTVAASTDISVLMCTKLYLDAGDTLGMVLWHNHGSARNTLTTIYTNMSIERAFPSAYE